MSDSSDSYIDPDDLDEPEQMLINGIIKRHIEAGTRRRARVQPGKMRRIRQDVNT